MDLPSSGFETGMDLPCTPPSQVLGAMPKWRWRSICFARRTPTCSTTRYAGDKPATTLLYSNLLHARPTLSRGTSPAIPSSPRLLDWQGSSKPPRVCPARPVPVPVQFLNKVLYAKEGAKDFMDRSCSNLPWHLRLEVDGNQVDIPEVRETVGQGEIPGVRVPVECGLSAAALPGACSSCPVSPSPVQMRGRKLWWVWRA